MPMAIIGMGCLFPKADSLGAYWANIKNGVDAIEEIPETHWRTEDYFDADPKAPDHTYGKRGGFLGAVQFDPLEYGIPPNDIEATDTAQLLGMMVANRALRDAGYGPDADFDRDRVSVMLGVTGALELVIPLGARLGHPRLRRSLRDAGVDEVVAEDVLARFSESYVPWQENSFPGLLGNVVAGRISKHLDLGGTNCVVDAACASSLSAMHLAQMELATGRADMVVTGGVDTFNDIFMYMCFSKTPALSPTGDAKPFDANCDGTTLGEGLGIIVMKRLDDAERDGDRIYAVLQSIGSSSDGKGEAIYAPSASGQMKALEEAYRLGNVTPDTIELVEGHGTGTAVGDAAEVKALSKVYGRSDNGPWCAIGSVKSQIGHTKACAGAAGIIKTALALHHKVLPPTIKVDTPLEALREANSPFYVNAVKRPWLPPENHPRRAAVSSFGFGGSNFHCVLEEHMSEKTAPDWDGDVEILPLCADTVEELADTLKGLKEISSWDEACLRARALKNVATVEKSIRLALVIEKERFNLEKEIDAVLKRLDGDGASWSLPSGTAFGAGLKDGELAFLFPGQGAQYVGMLRDIACQFPQLLQSLAAANSTLADASPTDNHNVRVSDFIYPPPAFDDETAHRQEDTLRATDVAQPAIGAVSAGALELLAQFGLAPDMVAGHSYGELVALYAAGRIDEEDLYRLSRKRGELMARGEGDRGTMLAVKADLETIEAILESGKFKVLIANKNAPQQAVLSGSRDEIARARKALEKRNIQCLPLSVAAAFHSPFVSSAEAPFLKAMGSMAIGPSRIPVFSNTTAQEYPSGEKASKELLASQLARPVEFVREIKAMYEAGARTFVEVGPGSRLTGLVDAILGDKPHSAVALDSSSGKRRGVADLARVLAHVFSRGYAVDFSPWNRGCGVASDDGTGKRPKFTVSISGANYVKPKPARPAAPKMTHRTNEGVASLPEGHGTVPSTLPAKSPALLPSTPIPSPPMKMDFPVGQGGMTKALQAAQENLGALQRLQEQTAQLHQRFLEGQQTAANTFQALLHQQQGVFGGGEPRIALRRPSDFMTPEEEVAAQTTLAPGAEVPLRELSQPEATPAPPMTTDAREAAPSPSVGTARIEAILLSTVAEKTGYPEEMLELDMSLDGDLGIDSIKRVEILSALQDQIPEAPEFEAKQLGQLQTLRQVVEHIAAGMPDSTLEEGAAATATEAAPEIETVLLRTISEKTGYPEEMLELDMSLDGDLGIDSIKRVEILSALQEEFPNAPDIEAKDLARLQTIRDVVNHLSASFAASQGKTASTESATSDVSHRAIIETTLLRMVAEKTGYPVEMLESGMALDGDLGIDSIKRVEILSALQEELPHLPEIGPQELGRLHTLDDVIVFLDGAAPKRAEEVSPLQATASSPPSTPQEIRRLVLRSVAIENSDETYAEPPAPSQGLVWITDEGKGLAPAIQQVLESKGFRAGIISLGNIDNLHAPDDLTGLIIVAPPSGADDRFLLNAFRLVQKTSESLREMAKKGGAILATVSRLDGEFGLGHSSTALNPVSGGLAGLLKTASQEWSHVRCKALDLSHDLAQLPDAAHALVEAILAPGPLEIGVTKNGLRRLELCPMPLSSKAAAPPLHKGDVVLVTGGARGVTAEVAYALAKAYAPDLVLVGRSPKPDQEPPWLAGLAEEKDIKRALMERVNGNATPKVIAREYGKIQSNREVTRTLERIAETGATARYYSADLRDPAAIQNLITTVEKDMGPIRAIVHGAGVLADKLIEEKTVEQFEGVYKTKIDGLRNLLEHIPGDDLRALVLFSSYTARLGRKGQADYAVANEVLNKMAQAHRRAWPECRVVSINWGPWDGGMVTPALAKVFAHEGVGLIGLEQGARFVVDELSRPPSAATEIVAIAGGPEELAGRDVAANIPAELRLAFDIDMDVESFPFLSSHVIDGHAVLPASFMLEWLAHGALHANPGMHFVGLDDFRMLKGVVLEDDQQYTLGVFVGKAQENPGPVYSVPVELRGVGPREDSVLHASAVILLSTQQPAENGGTCHVVSGGGARTARDIYDNGTLFHGVHFQGLETVNGPAEDILVGRARAADPPAKWCDAPLRSRWITDPLVVDCAFQLMVLWAFDFYGTGSLPVSLGSFRQYAPSFPKGEVTIQVRVIQHDPHKATAEIDFVDSETGRVVARINDYKCTLDESLNEAFKANSLYQGTGR